MVEANPSENNKNGQRCVVKHFPVDEEHSYVQYSMTLPEEAFEFLTGAN
jgi:hypothetical protein